MKNSIDGNIEEFGENLNVKCSSPSEKVVYYQETPHNPCEHTQVGSKLGMYNQYSVIGDRYFLCGKTVKVLDAGIYRVSSFDNQLCFEKESITSDSWLDFRDDIIQDVLSEIKTFWNNRDLFQKFGFLQRRGYIFYGPMGTGKTILLKQIMQKIVSDDGIVFLCDSGLEGVKLGLKRFREVEPDRKIVCIFEDIDAIIDRCSESSLLSLLDGEDSVDRVLNIATTNYPEKLDKRIVSRPRRFDRIIKIFYPDEKMRAFYFSNKLGIEKEELNKWVKLTDEFTFAALTELVISVKCLGNNLEESAKRLRELLHGGKPSSEDYKTVKQKVGFNNYAGGSL